MIHDLVVLWQELELREAVERVPFLVSAVPVLVYPQRFGLVYKLRDSAVDETDLLGAEVVDAVAGDHGEWFGGSVTAEADVYHPFRARREGDDVNDMEPREVVNCYVLQLVEVVTYQPL